MRTSLAIVLASALVPAASAQELISPFAAGAREGNSNNTIPWSSPSHRYQQVHGDLRAKPFTIQGISWRRDGVLPDEPTAVTRTLDTELRMARSNYSSFSERYANNYTGPVTLVVRRKLVSLPNAVVNQGTPAPWSIAVPFDTPFGHDGNDDLAWEVLIHSNTWTGGYYLDAHSGYGITTCFGSTRVYGNACTVTGRMLPLSLTARITAARPANEFEATLTVTEARPSSGVALLLGAAPIGIPIPGLCTELLAEPAVVVIGGADATGTFSTGPLILPFREDLTGRAVFGQAASADPGRNGGQLPFALSAGLEMTFPDLPARIRRVWANEVTATSGVVSEAYDYGLVVRFL